MNTTELKTLSRTLRNLAVNDSANEHPMHEAAGIIADNASLIAGAAGDDIGHAAKVFAAEADGLETERNDLLDIVKRFVAWSRSDKPLVGEVAHSALFEAALAAISKHE